MGPYPIVLSEIYRDSDPGLLVITETLGPYIDYDSGGGLTIDFEFGIYDNVPSSNVDLYVDGYYEGNPAHFVKLQQWNYTTGGWDNVTNDAKDFPSTTSQQSYVFTLLDRADYISSGNIKLRVIHLSNGSAGHYFHIDKFYLAAGGASHSLSPSISLSPSPSVSPSASLSPSESPSVSPSVSPSASASESPSISPSISASPSPSTNYYEDAECRTAYVLEQNRTVDIDEYDRIAYVLEVDSTTESDEVERTAYVDEYERTAYVLEQIRIAYIDENDRTEEITC